MPFTPFHMGAALIVKPVLNRHFSVITFGIAQIAMDIEPGIGMLSGADVLHGPSHTILGAMLIAFLVTLVAPRICSFLLLRWNKEVIHYKLHWLVEPDLPSRIAVVTGALFGTLSHLALDSLMHLDIHPLAPFSQANPLIGLISHDDLYQWCVVLGVLGTLGWIAMKWHNRTNTVDNLTAEQNPELILDTPLNFLAHWVSELRVTWLTVIFLCVAPLMLYGTAFFSVGVLFFAVFIVLPYTFFSQWANDWKGWKRLSILVAVSVLTTTIAFQLDEHIPANATPITKAIETFRIETGQYPDSLDMLIPKYLTEIPIIRLSLIQPKIWYKVKNGKPYLRIPSAQGDVFANFEYSFDTKAWIHKT